MAVSRFDRRPPERDQTRINERIRVSEVRLIDENGEQVGVIPTEQALAYAQERDLDLVEVAPEAQPPVCRVLDYSKYKYEQEQKAKLARKHQSTITIKEIKLRPKVGDREQEAGAVAVRRHGRRALGTQPLDAVLEELRAEIAARTPPPAR